MWLREAPHLPYLDDAKSARDGAFLQTHRRKGKTFTHMVEGNAALEGLGNGIEFHEIMFMTRSGSCGPLSLALALEHLVDGVSGNLNVHEP